LLLRTETDGYVKEADVKAPSIVANSTSQLSLDDALGTRAVSSTEVSRDQQLQPYYMHMQGVWYVTSEIGFRPPPFFLTSLLYLAAYVSAMQRTLYTVQGPWLLQSSPPCWGLHVGQQAERSKMTRLKDRELERLRDRELENQNDQNARRYTHGITKAWGLL